jgi:hypothetical protein
MDCTGRQSAGWIKLDLLSRGVEIDESVFAFLAATANVARRKNFYNTPIWGETLSPPPQELRVLGVVVGLNSYGVSPWRLSWSRDQNSLALRNAAAGLEYTAEPLPDLHLFARHPQCAKLANLYGGAALAFFSPRTCYFFADGTECSFCSLAGTAEETVGFKSHLSEADVQTTVRTAFETDPERIEQIMIVGGNMRDLDRGFRHHVSLAAAAQTSLREAGRSGNVSVHIATMPPRNLDLLSLLRDLENVHVMFNLEVWDPSVFADVCSGKQKDYGREALILALKALRTAIGEYRAHSLLVTGIETAESTITGARALAEMGVSPIINIYHSDRHSRLGLSVRPTFAYLAQIAHGVQELYDTYPLKPYWRNCGRNAIDSEASHGLFRSPVPQSLEKVTAC